MVAGIRAPETISDGQMQAGSSRDADFQEKAGGRPAVSREKRRKVAFDLQSLAEGRRPSAHDPAFWAGKALIFERSDGIRHALWSRAPVWRYPPHQPEALTDAIPLRCFLIARNVGFGKAGTERFCAGASKDEMLLRHGPENNPERRAMRRFNMRLPASVRVSGIPTPFNTETENVSARGIFFYIDRWMKEGSQIEVTMDFPSQVTLSEPVRVRFLARVVRVEAQTGMRAGVAAAIEEYEFLRSEEEGSAGLQPGWKFGA